MLLLKSINKLDICGSISQASYFYKMPSCQLLSYHYIVGKDTVVFQKALNKRSNKSHSISQINDFDVKAPQIKEYLNKYGHLQGEALKIFNVIEEGLSELPPELDIPLLILYNSGMSTYSHYDASDGFDNLKILTGPGDGTCQSDGAEYICDHWNQVKCFDAKSSDGKYSHLQMINAPDNMEGMVDFIDNPTKKVRKK